jgi:hypothetical protein
MVSSDGGAGEVYAVKERLSILRHTAFVRPMTKRTIKAPANVHGYTKTITQHKAEVVW